MDTFNPKLFALVTVLTTAIVGAVKKAFPKWADGKEPLLAVAIPVVSIVVLKLSGQIHGTDWIDAMILAVGSGFGAGVIHDKGVNPLLAGKDPSTMGVPQPLAAPKADSVSPSPDPVPPKADPVSKPAPALVAPKPVAHK